MRGNKADFKGGFWTVCEEIKLTSRGVSGQCVRK